MTGLRDDMKIISKRVSRRRRRPMRKDDRPAEGTGTLGLGPGLREETASGRLKRPSWPPDRTSPVKGIFLAQESRERISLVGTSLTKKRRGQSLQDESLLLLGYKSTPTSLPNGGARSDYSGLGSL